MCSWNVLNAISQLFALQATCVAQLKVGSEHMASWRLWWWFHKV